MLLPKSPRFAKRSLGATLLVTLVGSLAVSGCTPEPRVADRSRSSRADRQGASQRGALLDSIKAQLRTLPERTTLQLRPPSVVLDARSSTNGEEIRAALLRRPNAPPGTPANLIRVPLGNCNFKQQVRPGDLLKYFAVLDAETLARLKETGEVDIATFDAVEFTVAQVLDNRELLIEGGVPQEVDGLFRIEVWRVSDDRMVEVSRDLNAYATQREPPLAWQPSPDQITIQRLTERINEWLRQVGAAKVEWEPPKLLASLPDTFTSAEETKPHLTTDDLRSGLFRDYEVRAIQGAIWRRDLARWARGSDPAPLPVATALLDWVAANVQLVPPSESPARWPWELMLQGKATADGRAWVLVGLLEQLNLPAAVVSIPAEEASSGSRQLVGLLNDGQLYLLDPILGVPLRDASGQVATLSQLQADDSIARQLDLPETPYPVTADAAKEARVSVVATPFALTRRAAVLASRLSGDDTLTLATDVDRAAERIAAAAGVESVELWAVPFQTLLDKYRAKPSERRRAVREFLPFAWRPHLWKGRTLHFRGVTGQPGSEKGPLDDVQNDHLAAAQLYMDPAVRPSNSRLDEVTGAKREIYRQAKALATLWLGLLAAEQGSERIAANWLENGVFEHPIAEPLRPIARYNLARSKAELGDLQEASELLSAIEGPMAPAAKLMAQQLANEAQAANEARREADATPPTAESE